MARVFISLLTIFALAIGGQALAAWLGARIRARIRNRTGQTLDDVGGALVSMVAVLLVAWLVAAPLGSSSMPGLARSVRHSEILHGINAVMPDQAKSLSDALRRTVDTNDFPNVFGDLSPTEVRPVSPPDPALANSAVVTQAQRSVLKVLGSAPSCSRRIEGSGFVYAPEHMLTNAHVVAGTRSVSVDDNGDRRPGKVVEYDPRAGRRGALRTGVVRSRRSASPVPSRRPTRTRSSSGTRWTGRSTRSRRGSVTRDRSGGRTSTTRPR